MNLYVTQEKNGGTRDLLVTNNDRQVIGMIPEAVQDMEVVFEDRMGNFEALFHGENVGFVQFDGDEADKIFDGEYDDVEPVAAVSFDDVAEHTATRSAHQKLHQYFQVA